MAVRGKVIRDPIYGYIELTSEERRLIDLPVFQRLRRVSQLSLAELVYPNASHNRFSHSLGVMYLAKIVANHLITSGIIKNLSLSNEECELIIWAGLLHDIGHLPFSHVCEPAFAYFIDNLINWKDYHIEIGCRIIQNPDFGIKDILGNEKVKKICQIIKGESTELSNHIVEIITGICNIDRLDYLKRDAYHAGTSEYAIIDHQRVLTSLTVSPKYPHIAPIFKGKALYILEGIVLSYFFMYRTLYYHHALRASYLLFQEIIWDAFEQHNLKDKLKNVFSYDFWIHFDDHYFLTILREIPEISRQLNKLLFRDLPKLVKIDENILLRIFRFLESASYKEKVEKEREIAEKMKSFKVERIFLDSPMVIPYPRSLLAERKIYVLENEKTKPSDIGDISPYLRVLHDVAEKQLAARVYVLPGELKNNKEFIKELNKIIMEDIKLK